MIESKTDENLCFIDSNIYLYAFINSQDSDKSIAARSVIRKNDIAISTQIINEVCINLIRKALYPEDKTRELINSFYNKYFPYRENPRQPEFSSFRLTIKRLLRSYVKGVRNYVSKILLPLNISDKF